LNNDGAYPTVNNNTKFGHNSFHQDMLRIAVIVEDLRLPLDEGAKKTSYSIINSLIKSGENVSIFTTYKNPLLKNVYSLPKNKFLFGISFIHNLRFQAPDFILYIPSSSGTMGAFIRAILIKIQSSWVPLALLNLQFRKLPRYTHYLHFQRFVNIVFTQSEASANIFQSIGCATKLLPGGVDRTVFLPVSKQEKLQLRLQYRYQDTDRILLHVGHCNPTRNVIVLSMLAKLGFKVILVVSESTPIDTVLLEKLIQSGVIVITSFIENIQHYYQMADCYLFPVYNATSAIDAPLSVLEAMSCNTPIVATRFGALTELFQSGNGFYFANSDQEIIGMVEKSLLDHDCRTSEMVAPYTWDNAASTILKTLSEIKN
jgi:glycosyltransferase involved in cell wall biosynthesis